MAFLAHLHQTCLNSSHKGIEGNERTDELAKLGAKQGVISSDWKKSLIILIPSGKGVRPISLLSCFLKTMEKIIYNKLR